MKSCRQIYFDSRDIAYTTNTFSFACEFLCDDFLLAPFRSHHSIRSLTLLMTFTNQIEERLWANTLQTLTTHLRQLRTVELNVDFERYGSWAGEGSITSWIYSEPLLFHKIRRLPNLRNLRIELADDSATSWFNYIEVPSWVDPQWLETSKEELLENRHEWIEAAKRKLLGVEKAEAEV